MKIIKQFLIILVTVSILIFYLLIKLDTHTSDVNFVSCVDGDTAVFEIDGKKDYVRFLAIDTLEVEQSLGQEASNYVCKTLNQASKITLEYEENSYKDKYNRVLAWVYVDDKLIQEDLVRKGYAQVKYIYDDYKYVDRLLNLQEKAKQEKVGLWSEKYEK